MCACVYMYVYYIITLKSAPKGERTFGRTIFDEWVTKELQGCGSLPEVSLEDQLHQLNHLPGQTLGRGNDITLHVLILVLANLYAETGSDVMRCKSSATPPTLP